MHPRRIAATAAALMLVSAVAAPAVVGFEQTGRSGRNGSYTLPDSASTPGAICRYENHPGQKRDELNKISTRQMTARSPFSAPAWVGQRVLVQRNAKPFKDGKYKTVWKSSVIKRFAGGDDGSDAALFPARHWKAPENSRSLYRVKVVFTFFEKQSRTKIAGNARGIIEVYRGKQGSRVLGLRGSDGGPAGSCAVLARAYTP